MHGSLSSLGSGQGSVVRALLTMVFVFSAVVSGSAHSRQPVGKILAALRSPSSESSLEVIIQFDQTPNDKNYDLVRVRGRNQEAAPGLINGALFSLPLGAVNDLWGRSGVGTLLRPKVGHNPTTRQISIVYEAAAVWGTRTHKVGTHAAVFGTPEFLNETAAAWGKSTTSSPDGVVVAIYAEN